MRFFSTFYGEPAISPKVTFVKCLETEQRYDKRCRYKFFPAHPPASGNVFYATVKFIFELKEPNWYHVHYAKYPSPVLKEVKNVRKFALTWSSDTWENCAAPDRLFFPAHCVSHCGKTRTWPDDTLNTTKVTTARPLGNYPKRDSWKSVVIGRGQLILWASLE